MLHQLRSAIFIKPETNWQMVSPAFHFQFITVNTTIDLFYSLVGHFRALYQICRSLGVDNGRGGSRAQYEVLMTNKSDMHGLRKRPINVLLFSPTIFARDGPG